MANVSIKQIADLAGVSRGTVDRALNDRYGIDPDLKARILKIATELGYRSNRAGKMLSIRKSPLRIGVQMPSVGNDFFLDIEQGLQAAAKTYEDFGLTLEIRSMKGFDAKTQVAQVRELVAGGIHGLAIVPINHPDVVMLLDELAEKNIPVITFNTNLTDGKRMGCVGNDYWRSGATAAGVLRLLSHHEPTRVAILTGSVQMLGHNQRIHGFTQVIRQHCPYINILDVLETNDDDLTAFDLTRNLLAQEPGLSALYLTAGGVTGAARAIEAAGRSGQIQIIFHDLTAAEKRYLESGTIAVTIGQQPFEQGYKPVQYLFEYLLDGTLPPAETITRSEIYIREHFISPPEPAEQRR